MKKKVKNYGVATLVLMASCLFIASINSYQRMLNNQMEIGMGMEMEMEDAGLGGKAAQIIEAVKALYSLPTVTHHWILYNFKALLHQQGPNLDFRECSSSSSSMDESKEGATEKVKEAVVKSLDQSKATVEDSAKSAAEFAGETLDKTVKKLKKTLSGKPEVEAEL